MIKEKITRIEENPQILSYAEKQKRDKKSLEEEIT